MKTILSFLIPLSVFVALLSPGTVQATKHLVNVQNYSFSPSSLTGVSVGDTIRWVWVSGSHTTTSTSIPAGAASWNHPISSSSTSFEYKVTVAGTYDYKCTPHASMGMVGSFEATAAAPTLAVTPPNQNVSASAGSTDFSVASNSSWSASCDRSWCTITSSGSGNGTLTATYEANPAGTSRVAVITVDVSGLAPVTVTVTQDASSLSVAEVQADPFNVYPNPSKGLFDVSPGKSVPPGTLITIFDALGKVVSRQTVNGQGPFSFDFSSKSPGSYFIRLQSDTYEKVLKLSLVR